MAKNEDYWKERFEQLEEAQDKKGAEYYAELEKQYNKAALSVQADIERWYTRFAINSSVSLQDARKLLNSNELEEFKWNVMEYIEKGKTLNISNQWAKQLENASTRFHISRLDAIKLQIQNQVEVLYGNELDEVTELMTDIYTDGYYHTAYEIQKGFNIGYDLMKLDDNKVAKVLSKPWAADGSNFSDRIWKHKSQLLSELHNGLTQAIIRGQNPSIVTDAIAKRFNVSKGRAGALVMTESAFFAAASNHDCYKDLGVEQYEVLATLDKSTSDICRALDGKVFSMSEYAVGVTAPPFHVRCRTTTVPFFDDEFELDTKRAARDESGKTYYVPSDMKYGDWKKTFVDGGSKKDLSPIVIDSDSTDTKNVLNNNPKNGIINIEIDEFVPCLKDNKTGEIVETVVQEITDRKLLKGFNESNGWFIDWSKVPKEYTICALKQKGNNDIQGLVSYKIDPSNSAVQGHWIVASPQNRGKDKRFSGVGGHLYAIMVEASVKAGFDGFMYGKAANKQLLDHYVKTMGATPMGGLRFFIDEEEAHKLLDIYNYEWE